MPVNYVTLDYLADLTLAEMASAGVTSRKVAGPNSSGWDYAIEIAGSDPNALAHQHYVFTALEGASYTFASTSYFDPFLLRVADQYGNIIVANNEDDDGAGVLLGDGILYSMDAIFNWQAPYTGTFYVSASWNQGSFYSFYALSVFEDIDSAPPPRYGLSPSASSVSEGGTLTYTITTTNVLPGTRLDYALGGIAAADLALGSSLTGSVTVGASGSATLTVVLAADQLTEGPETISATLARNGTQVAVAAPVALTDSSAGAKPITGTASADVLVGTDASDLIDSGGGNDSLLGGRGNDTLAGGAGIDTALYSGAKAGFTIIKTGPSWQVTDQRGAEGNDTLIDVERVRFSDTAVAFDVDGNAGKAYRIYQAAFDRVPDLAGLGYWISAMDQGASLNSVARGFFQSNEFAALYGFKPSNSDMVGRFYQNVLHRAPDKAGFDYWVGILNANFVTGDQVLASFSESPENQAALIGVIGNGISYLPFG